MLKSTLKNLLPAALLFAGTSAFAQGTVTLADKTTATWTEVVKALNGETTDLDSLQQAVTDAQKALDRVEPKTETAAVPYLATQQAAANKFLTAYNNYVNDPGTSVVGNSSTIYYTKVKNKAGKYALTVGFTAGNDLKTATEKEFFDNVVNNEDEVITSLSIYLGATDGKNNYAENNGCYQLTSYTSASQDNIVAIAVDALNNTLPTLKAFQTTAQTKEYSEALKLLQEKEADLTKAQNDQKKYNTLTLTANVEATEAIANYAGTIVGNGYLITAPSNGSVFTTFTGKLSNAAVNGSLANSSMGATMDNVALWNNNKGVFYNGNGVATDYNTLGELAYAARDSYGVKDSKLASLRAGGANLVYNITVYPSATTSSQYYVTYTDGVYTNVNNGRTVTVGANVFVKSATNDLDGVNVIYNGTAKNVVITDKVDFFCPEEITADNVTYDRSFGSGFSAVCVPFEIDADKITGTVGVFEKVDEDKFWFTKTAGKIAANTPVVIEAESAFTLTDLVDVVIKATDTQIVAGNISEGGSQSFGLLKNAKIGEILGESQKNRVWGLTDKGTFQYGGNAAEFPAFRMVVATSASEAANAPQKARRIGFLNANGEDVTAVEDVANDAAALEVVGGVGEITINASADLGTVAVYTLDGKVAANANVAAGTATVNVAKGVYVVMGKKVLVK